MKHEPKHDDKKEAKKESKKPGPKKDRHDFEGKIAYVSVSPHGDPEGLVLEDGTFVKIPPHSLTDANSLKKGASVKGSGEVIEDGPNAVIHHAQVYAGKTLAADDSLPKDKAEALKEKHKKENELKVSPKSEKLTVRGKVVAYGLKPKGEVDRLIFADGTSVHVPKEVELESKDFEIGDEFEVKGQSKMFGDLRFVKADSVKSV